MSTMLDLSAPGRRRPAASSRARPRWRSWAGRSSEFGGGLVVTSSMADTVMIHLAEQVAPGIDVALPRHRLPLRGDHRHPRRRQAVHDVNLINVTPEHTVAEQDAAYGKDLFRTNPDQCCAMRKVAPLGKALEPYAAWATGRPPRRLGGPGEHARRRLGREAPPGQGRPDRHLDRRRRRDLHRGERPDGQPAAGGRLLVHRLRAVHAPARPATTPRPAAGPAWPRPSAGSTCERRDLPGHRRPHGQPARRRRGRHPVVHRPAVGRQVDHRARAGRPAAGRRRRRPGARRRRGAAAPVGRPRLHPGRPRHQRHPDRLGRPAARLPRRRRARAGHRPVRRRPAERPRRPRRQPACRSPRSSSPPRWRSPSSATSRASTPGPAAARSPG